VTARPLRSPARTPGLRVIAGRRTKRPTMAPWIVLSVITVGAFLALVGTRTALDRSALELAEINAAIAEEASLNQQLRIEIAELENPARIAPLADEMGLVIPAERRQLLVEGLERDDGIADPDYIAAVDSPSGPSS
jgi:cell division protein FtsL